MEVVVLGAAGDMGAVVARQLAMNEVITDLVLADLDVGGADRVAASIEKSGGSVRTARCDVLDDLNVRRLLDRSDLVVNCAGPYFRLGVPSIRAAIDTTTTYLDICDDPEPTIDMLRLNDIAIDAGVAAVVGMGASPGLSNLLAARAARRLDTVSDCITGWSLDDSAEQAPAEESGVHASDRGDGGGLVGPDGSPSGAVVHFMEQIHGVVPVVEDGVLVRRAPLSSVEIDYPGHGSGTGYVVGHPEPITLHRSLGVSGRSCNVVLVDDGATAAFLRGLQRDLDAGDLDLDQAGRALLRPSMMRLSRAAVAGAALRGSGSLPRLFAWMRGTVAGRVATVGCHVTTLPPGMSGATSVPAALAVGQLLASRPVPGVHAPEVVIDGDRLLGDLLPFCVSDVADVDALAPVVVSTSD